MEARKKHVGRTLTQVKKELLRNEAFSLEWDRQTQVVQIGEALARIRTQEEMTQAELAVLSGVKQSVIARLEKGDPSRRPRLDTLAVLINALGRRLVLSVI